MRTYVYLLLTGFLVLSGCTSDKDQSQQQDRTVEKVAINELLESATFHSKFSTSIGAQLIDVRTPAEVAQGYIKQSQNLNFNDEDFVQKLKGLSKDKPVFVYCASGGRSGKTAKKLKRMGFKEVYDLKGGIGAWEDAGLEVSGRE